MKKIIIGLTVVCLLMVGFYFWSNDSPNMIELLVLAALLGFMVSQFIYFFRRERDRIRNEINVANG